MPHSKGGARLAVCFTTLLVLAISSATASVVPAAAGRIESLMDRYAEFEEFSGTMLVAGPDGVIFEKAYGPANREWGVPNALDTRFRIGSLTKQFTASLVMWLADQGRLELDAQLGYVLPWYRQDTGQQVTIRQLLDHTSGIDRSGVPRLIAEHGRTAMPLREEIETYCSGDLEWEPGTRFAYNNAGYLILGAVVEEVSGVTYEELLHEVILDPLGMVDTGVDNSRRVMERRADGYDRTPNGIVKPDFVEATLAGPAGGMYSTPRDLYLWDRALYTDVVLSDAAREQMFTAGMGRYGLGWFIADMPVGPDGDERTVIRHPGEGDGFHSIVWRIPEDGVVVIMISNLGRMNFDDLAVRVLDCLYGREPLIGISAVVRHTIDTAGVDAARELYRRLREERRVEYDFAEDQLNELGYLLLRKGYFDAGLAVLEMNIEAYPGSANARDSLGEVLEHMGDTDGAVAAYRQALELDPEFEHAAQRLEELTGR